MTTAQKPVQSEAVRAAESLPWIAGDTHKIEGRAGTYRQILDQGGGFGSNIVAHVCVAHPANHELQKDGEANAALIVRAVNCHADLLAACKGLLSRYRVMGCGDGIEARAAELAITKAGAA
jgi:hypothetical protein